jgi:hypothetical protein
VPGLVHDDTAAAATVQRAVALAAAEAASQTHNAPTADTDLPTLQGQISAAMLSYSPAGRRRTCALPPHCCCLPGTQPSWQSTRPMYHHNDNANDTSQT